MRVPAAEENNVSPKNHMLTPNSHLSLPSHSDTMPFTSLLVPPAPSTLVSRSTTPVPQLPLKRSHDSTYLQSVFVGLSYDHVPSTSGLEGLDDLHWYISVSEGFAIQHSEKGEVKDVDLREGKGGAARVINLVVERLREFATSQNYKVPSYPLFALHLASCLLALAPDVFSPLPLSLF